MKHVPLHLGLAAIVLLTSTLHAQVPRLVNYQGRVAVNAVNFDGLGQFKFALVNTTGATTYWSNDGASAAGSQPVKAVSLPVSKGLYSVLLGDVSLTNMVAIPASVFTNADVRLRVWFNDGVNGSQLLTPDQRLAPESYLADGVVTAGAIADASIVGAKIATGSIDYSRLLVAAAPAAGQVLAFNGASLSWVTAAGGGGDSVFSLNGTSAYYLAGNVGLGTTTPTHRLTLDGGPTWTSNGWVGAMALPNASAIGWAANSAGQRFGMGHANTGFYLFRTTSNPGTTASPALYDFVVNDEGNVGIGTNAPTPGYKLDVNGATRLSPGNGTIQFGSPNAELGLTITPTAGNRADLRFDGSVLKLVASTGVVPPSAANGIAITTAGRVGIGTTAPDAKLHAETTQPGTVVYGHALGTSGIGVYGHAPNPGGIGVLGSAGAGGIGVYAGNTAGGTAVHADGNATQTSDKGGFVKAMAYIDPFLPAAQYVVRCFNSSQVGNATSTAPCGIQVIRHFAGSYTIDFGFNVEARFFSLTPRGFYGDAAGGGNGLRTGIVGSVTGNKVTVAFSQLDDPETTSDTAFYIIVY